MDIKTIEEAYNWRPQDGDYPSKLPFEESKKGFIKFLYNHGLLKYYRVIILKLIKYI